MEIAGLLSIVAPALLPAIIDGAKGLIGKVTGVDPAAPKSVEDAIRLKDSDTNRLRVLAEIDKPYGEISRWVSDMRASFRYIAIGSIILAYVITVLIPKGHIDPTVQARLALLAEQCLFFIIGDRVYTNLKALK